jgi:hypothetical protein
MCRLAFAALAVLWVFSVASAQDGPATAPTPEKMAVPVEEMLKEARKRVQEAYGDARSNGAPLHGRMS